MVIAYHIIFTTYGTWLPNDPRGSYSKKVYQDELAALGEVRYGRQNPQPPRSSMRRFRAAAQRCLSRPPYHINDRTRPVVARGFRNVKERLQLNVAACAIMNDHVHLLTLRSKYKSEYLMNQFKGGATAELKLTKTPWTRNGWKVFVDNEETLEAAAAYVEANPVAAGMPRQRWDFVTPLALG